MGDTPSWRQTTDAHCYSRALLATLFFSESGCGTSVCAYIPLLFLTAFMNCFLQPLIICLAACLLLPASQQT
jgi:hypothetical protein